MKWRKKVILAKIESTYGTDATPAGGTDAMLVANVSLTPLVSDPVERANVQPYLGSRQQLHTGVRVTLEFDVEIAGGGAVDTPPPYGPLLRGCGMAETITATISVAYDPVSANEESLTIYFHMDGSKHALLGARGTFEVRINAKQIPYLHFAFTGMYVAPSAVADPTPTLSGFQLPKTVGNTNTPTFTLHGFSGKLSTFTMTQGNTVVHRDLVGEEAVVITDRRSTGNIVMEAPDLGDKNYFTASRDETLAALQIVHGTAAGNTVQLDASNTQLLQPAYSEQDALAMLGMQLNFVPSSSGDDEFKITTK